VINVISEPPHEQTDQEPKPDEPSPPLATCGEAGSAVGQATHDVADADVAAGICEQSSAHCIVCVQPDGSGRFAVYEYESIDCACPALPSTLPSSMAITSKLLAVGTRAPSISASNGRRFSRSL